ncbi:MAG: nuclear transport factor 2 family protein [Acidimicrobiia bacterium]|nr:nuclear transport factor 2 family protein [Acidimicrobiia bacterium]
MDRLTDTLRDTIVDLEHRFWEASTDPDFYRDHALPDAVMVFPGGHGIVPVDRVIDMVDANTVPWASYALGDLRVVEGVDSVILTYRATARKAGEETEMQLYASTVYVQLGGAWKLALHQQTLA